MKTFRYNNKFETENGEIFDSIVIAYHTWGELNSRGDNVIWVCHALTASSDVAGWWPGMVGKGLLLDPRKYFIVCANILGSCYGSTSPLSVNPATGKPWLNDFPVVTTRDHVRAHELLRKHLGISSIHTLIGASIGGHQALEYAIMFPELIDNLVFIASNAKQSPWAIAFNESQRLAQESDPTFFGDNPGGGRQGLKAARSIALLSYRNQFTYNASQAEENDDKLDGYRACSYQAYQGEKLVRRFNPWSYYRLTQVSDSHNTGRGRGGPEKALGLIRARTLCIGISSDILFPVEEQQFVAQNVADGRFVAIDSLYGHDGFLIEIDKISSVIREFWEEGRHPRDNDATEVKEYDVHGLNGKTVFSPKRKKRKIKAGRDER